MILLLFILAICVLAGHWHDHHHNDWQTQYGSQRNHALSPIYFYSSSNLTQLEVVSTYDNTVLGGLNYALNPRYMGQGTSSVTVSLSWTFLGTSIFTGLFAFDFASESFLLIDNVMCTIPVPSALAYTLLSSTIIRSKEDNLTHVILQAELPITRGDGYLVFASAMCDLAPNDVLSPSSFSVPLSLRSAKEAENKEVVYSAVPIYALAGMDNVAYYALNPLPAPLNWTVSENVLINNGGAGFVLSSSASDYTPANWSDLIDAFGLSTDPDVLSYPYPTTIPCLYNNNTAVLRSAGQLTYSNDFYYAEWSSTSAPSIGKYYTISCDSIGVVIAVYESALPQTNLNSNVTVLEAWNMSATPPNLLWTRSGSPFSSGTAALHDPFYSGHYTFNHTAPTLYYLSGLDSIIYVLDPSTGLELRPSIPVELTSSMYGTFAITADLAGGIWISSALFVEGSKGIVQRYDTYSGMLTANYSINTGASTYVSDKTVSNVVLLEYTDESNNQTTVYASVSIGSKFYLLADSGRHGHHHSHPRKPHRVSPGLPGWAIALIVIGSVLVALVVIVVIAAVVIGVMYRDQVVAYVDKLRGKEKGELTYELINEESNDEERY